MLDASCGCTRIENFHRNMEHHERALLRNSAVHLVCRMNKAIILAGHGLSEDKRGKKTLHFWWTKGISSR